MKCNNKEEFGKAVKKPIVINWFKYEANPFNMEKWINSFGDIVNDHFIFEDNNIYKMKVKTLEGSSYDVPVNYIIIRGIKGEYYPCDPKIFQESYDIVT